MSSNMVRSQESSQAFGRDIGLVHEAIVTGRKVGADRAFWSKIAHDESLLRRLVATAVVDGHVPTVSQRAAQRIMAPNFFGIESVARVFGAVFSRSQLAKLAEVPYDVRTLERFSRTHVLVAGFHMTIVDMIKQAPPKAFWHGQSVESVWYRDEDFAASQEVFLRWYLIRNDTIQTQKLSGEHQLRACEFVYATILSRFERGRWLCDRQIVRCTDLDRRVAVGTDTEDCVAIRRVEDMPTNAVVTMVA